MKMKRETKSWERGCPGGAGTRRPPCKAHHPSAPHPPPTRSDAGAGKSGREHTGRESVSDGNRSARKTEDTGRKGQWKPGGSRRIKTEAGTFLETAEEQARDPQPPSLIQKAGRH